MTAAVMWVVWAFFAAGVFVAVGVGVYMFRRRRLFRGMEDVKVSEYQRARDGLPIDPAGGSPGDTWLFP